MNSFQRWTILFVSLIFLATITACDEKGGTTIPPVFSDVESDTGEDVGFGEGDVDEPDVHTPSDVDVPPVPDAGPDAGPDAEPDTGVDAGPDVPAPPGEVGDPCNTDAECVSGICLQAVDYGICTQRCEDYACDEGWTCERFVGGGQACVPVNHCFYPEGDDFGVGRGCPDCGEDGCPEPECSNGEQRRCYEGHLDTRNVGLCRDGIQTCSGRQWGPCVGQVLPAQEVCDGLDNNCDGVVDDGVRNACGGCGPVPEEVCNGVDDNCNGIIDEGCDDGPECQEGETMPCYEGDSLTRGVGLCRDGVRTCSEGSWGACLGQVLPGEEVCDGLDNDCDGQVDEGLLNACGTCGPVPREVCNGQDDNCNGIIDDGVKNRCGTCGPCGEAMIFPSESGFGDPSISPAPDGAITLGSGSVQNYHLWVPNSNENTVSRWNTRTKREEARYWVGADPSRTAIDLYGNAWVGNRGDGIATYIMTNPADCEDRNGDGVIQTSRDLNGDGRITAGELVNSAQDPLADECIKCRVRVGTATDLVRGVAIDGDNYAWVGTWSSRSIYKIDPSTCEIVATVPVNVTIYGLVIDSKGYLWTSSYTSRTNVKVDTKTATEVARFTAPQTLYGIAVDGDDNVWYGNYSGGILKFDTTEETWHTYAPGSGLSSATGIMVGLDGRVYVAGYNSNNIVRFDPKDESWQHISVRAANTGLLDQTAPRGVIIDADNTLWAINRTSSGLSQFTLDGEPLASVPIRGAYNPSSGVSPYSYSDNTGFQLLNYTTQRGAWRYVFDAGQDVFFANMTYAAYIPADGSVEVRMRAASEVADLSSEPFTEYLSDNPVDLRTLFPQRARYLEMDFLLVSSTPTDRPVLRDIQVFFENDDCRVNGCPGQQHCGELTGSCIVLPTQCSDDNACEASQYCDPNGYCSVGCRLPNSCGPGQVCNTSTRVCEVRNTDCLSDSACAAGSYCANGFCEPGCRLLPDNCPLRYACDADSRLCEPLPPECADDDDCASGRYCDGFGRCLLGCRVGADDCGDGEICSAVTHACIPTPPSCDPDNSQPETCNGRDDDCDGVIDNDAIESVTCDVGTSGASGFTVCFDGQVYCQATASLDPENPVELTGALTNVLLPAGYWAVTAATSISGRLYLDEGAELYNATGGVLNITGSSARLTSRGGTTRGLGFTGSNIILDLDDAILEGTPEGTVAISSCNTMNAVGSVFENIALTCVNATVEYSRFISTDSRVRTMLTVRNITALNNSFEGRLIVPRIQNGLRQTSFNAEPGFYENNQFMNLSDALTLESAGTTLVGRNVFYDNDHGVKVSGSAFPTIEENFFNLNDIGHVGTAIAFISLAQAGGANVFHNDIRLANQDAAFLLDPNVFQIARPAQFIGNAITGIPIEDAWRLMGIGSGGENDVVLYDSATRYVLQGNVSQSGGILHFNEVDLVSMGEDHFPYVDTTASSLITFSGTSRNVRWRSTTNGSMIFDGAHLSFGDEATTTMSLVTTNTNIELLSSVLAGPAGVDVNNERGTGLQIYGNGVVTIEDTLFQRLNRGIHLYNTADLSLTNAAFSECATGIYIRNSARVVWNGGTFVDALEARSSIGIDAVFDAGSGFVSIADVHFVIGAEDRPFYGNLMNFMNDNPITLSNLTFENDEQGVGMVIWGNLRRDATLDLGDFATIMFENAAILDGGILTIPPGKTLRGVPGAARTLRVQAGGLVAHEGVRFENLTVQNDATSTTELVGAEFIADDTIIRTFLIAGGQVSCEDCVFVGTDQRQHGVDAVANATVVLENGAFENLNRAAYVRNGTNLTVTGADITDAIRAFDIFGGTLVVSDATMTSTDDGLAMTALYVNDNTFNATMTFENLTFDIGPDDTPVWVHVKTFHDTNAVTMSGTSFLRDQGDGWKMWGDLSAADTATLRHWDPIQEGWRTTATTRLRSTVAGTVLPGTIIYSTTRQLLEIRDTATITTDDVTFHNVRLSFIHSAEGELTNTDFICDVNDTNPQLTMAGTTTVNVYDSLFNATGACTNRSHGIYVNGELSPTIATSHFETLNRALWLVTTATPTLIDNTFTDNLVDYYP